MRFAILVCLTALMSWCRGSRFGDEDPTIPEISKDFTCDTEEEDSAGKVVLLQQLVWSASYRRSRMSAKGSLVKGFMEQIKRCDLLPDDGWFTNAGGPSGESASDWSCTNMTIPAKSETPNHCVYGNFWEINSESEPKYMGIEMIKGTACDRWDYETTNSQGEKQQMAFWARPLPSTSLLDGGGRGDPVATPCATSQLGVWTLYIVNFRAGQPAIDLFDPTSDYECPAASTDSEVPAESSPKFLPHRWW